MAADTRRLIRADDLFALVLPSDPQISPDGSRIVFVRQRTDVEKNRYLTDLWLIDVETGDSRPFTTAEARDSAPRWSPDGRHVSFVSDRDDTSQIWSIPADGGEARMLTSLPEGALSPPVWSPDGASILFSFRPKPEADTKKAREQREKEHRSTPPRVIRRLRYREEAVGFTGEERWHLWLVRVSDGETRQLTDGGTDERDPVWSPDGRSIAFVSNRSPDPERTPGAQEIWLMDVAGAPANPRRLPAPSGPKHSLAWSPDGREIAYIGHARPDDVWGVTNPSLWRVPVEARDETDARDVAAGLDRPVGDTVLSDVRAFGGGGSGPIWTEDGGLLFLVSDSGSVHLYLVDADGKRYLLVGGSREVAAVSADREGRRLALLIGSPLEPGDIHLLRSNSPPRFGEGPGERLTHLNVPLLDQLRLAEPEERFRVASYDGLEVHGWLLRPPDLATDAQPPLILYVHGGPHSQYGSVYTHEMQVLAAQGYCVLYTNPRGSKGYGEAFTNGVRGCWGEADFGDLMAMVDAVVARGEVDPERLGITGGSYGGFMTNWVISHTDRFRAAVTQRCVANLATMAGTCDFGFDDRFYFDANAWDDRAVYERLSPLTYAANVRTPLLILHAEGDLRCPIEQAEQWYGALNRLGCEVEFVRYGPEANHGLTRSGPPDLRLDHMQRIAAWMDRYLKAAGSR